MFHEYVFSEKHWIVINSTFYIFQEIWRGQWVIAISPQILWQTRLGSLLIVYYLYLFWAVPMGL